MKWDVKHDRAKKVIDRFLDNAGYWQESEDLVVQIISVRLGILSCMIIHCFL